MKECLQEKVYDESIFMCGLRFRSLRLLEEFDFYTDYLQLTDIEKKNIALIKRYEKYADDYGDDFGR